jgi:hypothetical protein
LRHEGGVLSYGALDVLARDLAAALPRAACGVATASAISARTTRRRSSPSSPSPPRAAMLP